MLAGRVGRDMVRALYPPQCLACAAPVADDFALCPACWREAPFVIGLACDTCGRPLPGGAEEEGVLCDDCLRFPCPWDRGSAAFLYSGTARRLILALKHGDRTDIARPAGQWMARAAAPLIQPGMLVAPVPLHWRRLFRRRYNQSALLARALARVAGLPVCPDLLVRPRFTGSQEGRDRAARFGNVADAITCHPRRRDRIAGRPVLLVDDVMTSGATLSACTAALREAGASSVSVVVFARVAKEG